MWLLVGVRPDEVPSSFPHEFKTLDIEDADICGEIFDTGTWLEILNTYGEKYFDAIMTDGGLMYVQRNEEIIKIKNLLLKDTGKIYNYTSVIGRQVNDPLERGYRYIFYEIPKKDYTVLNHDMAWANHPRRVWSDQLRCKVRLII